MANKHLIQEADGTPEQICFRDSTDFSPTASKDLRISTPTLVQLDLTSLGDTAARQSAKFDFGEHRAPAYVVRAAVEFAATPTAGDVCELYMGYSDSSTAANGNGANLSGSDAAYTGYSSDMAASVKQLHRIGTFICTARATGTIQIAECGIFQPRGRYGILVFRNESGAAVHSDADEHHIVLTPVVPETQ